MLAGTSGEDRLHGCKDGQRHADAWCGDPQVRSWRSSAVSALALPEVVMLPGLDGTGAMSVHFLSALQAHGLATRALALPAEGGQQYPALATWIWPRLPRSPFVLIAESFSGPLALELAARRPGALRGLVLAATFVRRPVPLPAASAALLLPAWPMPPPALLAPLLLGRWRTGAHLVLLRAALAQVPAATLRQRAAATLRVDGRALLPRIAVPTLSLQGRQDRLLWPASVTELRALLPEAQHVALEGPHLLLQACAEPAAAVVAGWVKALPRID